MCSSDLDLGPLTRESLSRPVENDIRYALQRVPEAAESLRRMERRQREARIHTFFASGFLSAFVLTQIWRSRDTNEKNVPHYRGLTWGFGGMFVFETIFSTLSTRAAKRDLVHAVEEFNAHSPYKMEPASGQGIENQFPNSSHELEGSHQP